MPLNWILFFTIDALLLLLPFFGNVLAALINPELVKYLTLRGLINVRLSRSTADLLFLKEYLDKNGKYLEAFDRHSDLIHKVSVLWCFRLFL